MDWNRRAVVGAGLGLAAGPAGAQTVGTVRTRPAATSPEGRRQLAILARAMPVLRREGAWARQAAIHADMAANQHHRNWRFLPWHRAQLLWFERLVADVAGESFSVPYWDWTALDPLPPDLFDTPELRVSGRLARRGEKVPTALRDSRFQGRMRDGAERFLGTPVTRRAGGVHGFGGSCETFGHNAMHNFVGGAMNAIETAPDDPAFWLHHCNVDRIWASWERYRRQPYPAQWQDERIGGFARLRGAPPPPVRAATLTDTTKVVFPYGYDALLGELVVFAPAPSKAAGPRLLVVPPTMRAGRVRFDVAAAMAGLDRPGRGEGWWRIEAVVHTTPQVNDPLTTTFALSREGVAPIRSAVFQSAHHPAGPHRIDVTELMPGFPLEPGAAGVIELASEDVFQRGGAPMTFRDSVLVLTARWMRPA